MKRVLRSGYTTGACAAAAARGAALMLARQELVSEVTIEMPGGESATFSLHGQVFTGNYATCFVIKDAGDDPDVTNGAEVHASVSRSSHPHPHTPLEGEGVVLITGGTGIGRVTKPGLAVPPGEWAINPVPRRMIQQSVRSVLSEFNLQHSTLSIIISIPDGEQRAQKTLNARLGIVGGLSILGTTGIVRPISAKAWTDTIDAALDVARACGCENVVLSTGRTSELAAQQHFPSLPEEACIMMGDHVAHALRACAQRGFMQPVIACQFAKLLKIACGHPNTHAAASQLDLAKLRRWTEQAGFPHRILSIITNANTAREIAITSAFDPGLMELVAGHALQASALHAPGISALPLLCGYDGAVIFQYSKTRN
ncbi:MAG: cobalt-precorrin-5B (C(1))-methyltransferase CbiD [Deltaproteobacteria bacterium]|nr:cobalt-precorrin-5B (C(1))-methyltransferase CbiD [Deltaproteobacteria bacterium]